MWQQKVAKGDMTDMIQNEYSFTRDLPIEDFYSLLLQQKGAHAGWKFEAAEPIYTIVWTPMIILNVWRLHPKVTAKLEVISEDKTLCKIKATNKGFMDPFGLFKSFHDKTVEKLFRDLKE